MNREIIYRGKHTDKCSKKIKWIEGYYWFDKWGDGESHYILYDTEDYLVDPYTVGEYTGLTDKNGVKIFEGDILQAHDYPKDSMSFPVTWFNDSACFNLMGLNTKAFVIAGNIHDKEGNDDH